MKNKEIGKYLESLDIIKDLKLGATISLVIARNKKNLLDDLKLIEGVRTELATKLCSKDENDKPLIENNAYIFSDENKEIYIKEYLELLEVENTVKLEKVKLSMLDRFDDITPEQMEVFLPILE